MSDFDNIREDRYSDQAEREEALRDLVIDMHTDNWLTAVTQSVEKSHGTFKDVREYKGEKFNFQYVTRPANSVDVFIEELHNKDFMERAAQILIDLNSNTSIHEKSTISQLFSDMADSYAEYQYESNIKD
jgi:hypothetical protein